MQSFRGAIHRFSFAKGSYEQIKQLSHEADTTLFMTLFASFNTLLHRYSGQEDLWVGSAIANRNRTEIEELMGFFGIRWCCGPTFQVIQLLRLVETMQGCSFASVRKLRMFPLKGWWRNSNRRGMLVILTAVPSDVCDAKHPG